MMNDNSISVQTALLSGSLTYAKEILLTYSIAFPQFQTNDFAYFAVLQTINSYYCQVAYQLLNECKSAFYQDAQQNYEYAKANHVPFFHYEVVLTYKVTDISNDFISLYMDRYLFTGGAHGNTIRTSNTWDLQTGEMVDLSRFFPQQSQWKQQLFSVMEAQIQDTLKVRPTEFFDDYSSLLRQAFNESQFYLTPDGIVIYYQQYDLGPYSSGIPQFLIPYSNTSFL